ncbi:MAG TPA: BTAD domain-containing putative transcriptional regulator [Solirubrobacteraceae bacterium]|nr:BTAD domain-containing putative transcriptional regulator [Solirubrobacteraceae bacterium]
MGIEFRILGPLEVRLDGTPIRIGGPRQRALLAVLLLSANRAVSRDQLVDELLPEASPDGADHQLRVQVSRLRRALNTNGGDVDRLRTSAPGYLLRVEQGELDLHRFEHLVGLGDGALEAHDFLAAANSFCEAEALWRGRALADLEFEPFARVDVGRLNELRLVAMEKRIEAELSLGRHAMLVPTLEAAVAEHPMRERLRALLMLALYRCGRQADALETYRAGRTLLNEELALEPSPALRQLEQSILRQEAGLELSDPAPGALATEVVERSAPPALDRGVPDLGGGPTRAHRGHRRALVLALVLGVAAILAGALIVALGGSRTLTASANSVGVIDTGEGALTTVVQTGAHAGGIAAGQAAVWETDTANGQLLKINPRSRAVERIAVGRGPRGVAVGGGEVWVVNQLDRTVSEINPRALRAVASFPVGNGADAVAFGFGSVWVTNVLDDTVSRIDPATGRVSTIPLAGQPGGIAAGREGVWVTSESTGQLLLIDPTTDEVTQQKEIGGSPAAVATGARSVWVANADQRSVARFIPGKGTVTSVDVGNAPLGVAYGAGAAWAAVSPDGDVARIDPRSDSVHAIRVGAAPNALAVNGRQLWTTVLAGPAEHRGGVLTMAEGPQFASTGTSLYPAQFAGMSQWQMLSMTNDGLVTYKRVGGLAGNTLVPDLASSLPAPTDHGRTYTFRLRSGIRYSNGALVRPIDFKRELERIFRLGNTYAETFYTGLVGGRACVRAPRSCSLASGVVADDRARTITFHLTTPDPDFLYKLAFPWADAVPAVTPAQGLGHAMPPATGPYMTQSIKGTGARVGSHRLAFRTWTLVRNPRFHEWSQQAQPSGFPDKIVLTQDHSVDRAVDAITRHRLDVLNPVPSSRLGELAAHYTGQFHSEPARATFAPVMNTRVAPFNRTSVRRALNFAIDRRRILSLAGGPLAGQVTCQILPPTLTGYKPYCPYTLKPYSSGTWTAPDLPRARRLVDSSGTRGMKVTLWVQPNDQTNPTAKVGPYLVSVLDRLGYRASLRVTDNLYPTASNSRSRVQIAWFNWLADYPAPSDFISLLLTCGSYVPASAANLNEAEFCSRKIDGQIRAARALEATNPGAASDAWTRIDRHITDQAPWLALYNPRQNIVTSSRVGNYQYHPFFLVLLDQLWVR